MLSIIIPAYNEEAAIAGLCSEVEAVCRNAEICYELLVIDDGSNDRTFEVARTTGLARVVRLRANMGQSTAMEVGIRLGRGTVFAFLDGDGQNDPAAIPGMIGYLNENSLDMVVGWRVTRRDKLTKRIPSRVIYLIRKLLIHESIHDSGCTLKVMSSECAKSLRLRGQLHRFIPATARAQGFRIGEMPVPHRPRTSGKSKYNWKRGINGITDLLLIWYRERFRSRPAHLFGGFALILSMVSVGTAVFGILNIDIVGDLSRAAILIGIGALGLGLGVVIDDLEAARAPDPVSFIVEMDEGHFE